MNAQLLSDAIGEIDSQYIAQAICYRPTKSGRRRLAWTAAACLCLVIAAGWGLRAHFSGGVLSADPTISSEPDASSVPAPSPGFLSSSGLLCVTAYALSADEETDLFQEYQLSEGLELPAPYGWCPLMSNIPGLPLKLSMADNPAATFQVSTEEGRFLLWDSEQTTSLGSAAACENDTVLYWNNLSDESDGGTTSGAYVDVVIYDGGNIIGYAVIQIYTVSDEANPFPTYFALLLQSVSFPKVNGEYQPVTEEYVLSQIKQIKAAG